MQAHSHSDPRLRLGSWLLVKLAVAALLLALCSPAALAAPPVHPSPPGAITSSASNVTFSSANLSGFVNPHGQTTNYFFRYGTTSAYGAQTPLAPAGNGTLSIKASQAISGLQPATTYHYRFFATSSAGTISGSDRAFTTPKIPLSLQIVGVPNPVSFGDSLVLEGTLSGTGAANHPIVLQANPFPYLVGFKTVGNPELTSATGGFSFPVVGLLENTQLRVQTLGSPLVTSQVVVENVAVRVVLHVRRTHRRGRVRLYGTVSPAEPGAQVGFQRLVAGGRTVNAGGTLVKPGTATLSRFSRTVRLRHRGLYRALVKVSDGAHLSAYSAPVLIR